MVNSGETVQIIDTRPKHYGTKAQDMMEGAVWRDPERVDDRIGELSMSEPVVTFRVYGFPIGGETAATLRNAPFNAQYVAGGHYAWMAIRGPVKLLECGPKFGHGRLPASRRRVDTIEDRAHIKHAYEQQA
jgi:Fe-Mn family superoxide dismutase